MERSDHFDFDTPETGKPFLVGYRKFIIALLWFLYALFAGIMVLCGWAPKRADVTTLAIWVIGTAGFFGAFFVGGNILVTKWVEFFKHSSTATLSQSDTRQEVIYQDTQEDSSWQAKEKEMEIK